MRQATKTCKFEASKPCFVKLQPPHFHKLCNAVLFKLGSELQRSGGLEFVQHLACFKLGRELQRSGGHALHNGPSRVNLVALCAAHCSQVNLVALCAAQRPEASPPCLKKNAAMKQAYIYIYYILFCARWLQNP